MSDALSRIKDDFREFCTKLGECGASGTPADYRDAYNRFSIVVDRFIKEEGDHALTKPEHNILKKEFESNFIKGLKVLNNVSKHVKRNNVTIQMPDGENVTLSPGSSARAVFFYSNVCLWNCKA